VAIERGLASYAVLVAQRAKISACDWRIIPVDLAHLMHVLRLLLAGVPDYE